MPAIILESSDGEVFEVDLELIRKFSGTINTMMQSCNTGNGGNIVVPVSRVRGTTLRKVLEYANHHKDDPAPDDETEENFQGIVAISEWDAEFLKVDQAELLDIVQAANFLDSKKLYKVSCQAVANLLKGKSAAQLRAIFNIETDCSDDELDQGRWVAGHHVNFLCFLQ